MMDESAQPGVMNGKQHNIEGVKEMNVTVDIPVESMEGSIKHTVVMNGSKESSDATMEGIKNDIHINGTGDTNTQTAASTHLIPPIAAPAQPSSPMPQLENGSPSSSPSPETEWNDNHSGKVNGIDSNHANSSAASANLGAKTTISELTKGMDPLTDQLHPFSNDDVESGNQTAPSASVPAAITSNADESTVLTNDTEPELQSTKEEATTVPIASIQEHVINNSPDGDPPAGIVRINIPDSNKPDAANSSMADVKPAPSSIALLPCSGIICTGHTKDELAKAPPCLECGETTIFLQCSIARPNATKPPVCRACSRRACEGFRARMDAHRTARKCFVSFQACAYALLYRIAGCSFLCPICA